MGLLSLFKNDMQKQDITGDGDSGDFRSSAESETKPSRSNGKRATSNRKAKVVDPVLPEKKRARRRLIGAVALVLAAVIGLPMLLDSEPKLIADDISIQIPSKDKPMVADAPSTAAPVAMTPALTEKNKPVDLGPAEEIIGPVIKASPGAIEKPIQSGVKSETKSEAKAEPKPSAKPETKPDVKTETKSDQKSSGGRTEPASKVQSKIETADEASRAMAILEGKSPAKIPAVKIDKNDKSDNVDKADKAGSGFVVQVAALASQEKVNDLQKTLKAANIKSYTQKVATTSGEKIRVRVGPFESKDEADKMRARLLKMGLSGTMVPN